MKAWVYRTRESVFLALLALACFAVVLSDVNSAEGCSGCAGMAQARDTYVPAKCPRCDCVHHTSPTSVMSGGPWVDNAAHHVTEHVGDIVVGIYVPQQMGVGHYTVVLQPLRDQYTEHTDPGRFTHRTRYGVIQERAVTRRYQVHRLVVLGFGK